MDPTRTLVNAQINFIDEQLRLIHIPRSCYSQHVQTILKLLFPVDDENDGTGLAWTARRPFVNISINSVECSILCSSKLAEEHFGQYMNVSTTPKGQEPAISKEQFVVMSVEGEGMEAGQRVLDLTTPLAMASIPIFFITTYFCDYLLVPLGARSQVIHALEERGFVFEAVPGGIESHVNVAAHHRNRSSTTLTRPSSNGETSPTTSPSTPPPTSVSELQERTFRLLGRHNIKPRVLSTIRLVQCAGRRGLPSGGMASSHELALQLGLVKCLAHPPRWLSATFTATEPPAFLLEEGVRKTFFSTSPLPSDGPTEADVLMGGATSPLVPIMLNLESLPIEATGIVCGVAGKLAEDTRDGVGAIEMSYLSTSRTGTVLVEENDLTEAVNALGCGEMGVDVVTSD